MRAWLIVAGCAALAGCEKRPKNENASNSQSISATSERYTFYCLSRMRSNNWDGQYKASVQTYSYCTTDRAACAKATEAPPVALDQPHIILSTPCVETAHAFCFAFVDPSSTPAEAQQQVRTWIKEGSALTSCMTSWHECHEEWLGHYELPRFGEKYALDYESTHKKTDCELY